MEKGHACPAFRLARVRVQAVQVRVVLARCCNGHVYRMDRDRLMGGKRRLTVLW